MASVSFERQLGELREREIEREREREAQ